MSVEYSQNGEPRESGFYRWQEHSLTVDDASDPTTDITSIAGGGFEDLFEGFKGMTAQRIQIEASGTIYVRLNDVTNDVIKITATTPYVDEYCQVNKIFISTVNAAVTVTIRLK